MNQEPKNLAVPGINSTIASHFRVVTALEDFKNIPNLVELDLQKKATTSGELADTLAKAATKKLNAGREERIFNRLLPLDTPESVKEQLERKLAEDFKEITETRTSKDWMPKLEDFQRPQSARLRHRVPQPKALSVTSGDEMAPFPKNPYQLVQTRLDFSDDLNHNYFS